MPPVSVEHEDGVAVLRMAHGPVNALDLELLEALIDVFGALGDRDAVVLTGTGRAFSAGVDLRRIADGGEGYARRYLPLLRQAFLTLFDFPRPLVAAVNGHAIAGGCILVQTADLRLMAAGTIGVTELRVGVPFPAAALEILRWATGPAAPRLVLEAQAVAPEPALAAGLVDRVVAPEDLAAQALDAARGLAAIPRGTFTLTKRQLRAPAHAAIAAFGPRADPEVDDLWAAPATATRAAAFLAAATGRPRAS
jgi:enoyl-CoA hydratase